MLSAAPAAAAASTSPGPYTLPGLIPDVLAQVAKHLRPVDLHSLDATCRQLHTTMSGNRDHFLKVCRNSGDLSPHTRQPAPPGLNGRGRFATGRLRDGLRHGTWYTVRADTIVAMETYHDGVLHGPARYFRANTTVRAVYSLGLLHGPCITTFNCHYREDMLRRITITTLGGPGERMVEHFALGVLHGTTTFYTRFGDPSSVQRYTRGVPCGEWVSWHMEDGSLKSYRKYHNGEVVQDLYRFTNGRYLYNLGQAAPTTPDRQ